VLGAADVVAAADGLGDDVSPGGAAPRWLVQAVATRIAIKANSAARERGPIGAFSPS
jgi:hypothetical protein